MGKGNICQSVAEIIEPVVHGENLELVDVEFKKEGKTWYLRVYIDKERGVSIEDCRNVSHQIEDLIEIENIVSRQYILEVSSPGLDRPLKSKRDFLRNQNRRIQLTVFAPIHGRKDFRGVIQGIHEQSLVLQVEGSDLEIPLEKIAKAKLVIDFS
ncbi:MAG: ribosome maturation factor RimP [Nitrospinales bacterium]